MANTNRATRGYSLDGKAAQEVRLALSKGERSYISKNEEPFNFSMVWLAENARLSINTAKFIVEAMIDEGEIAVYQRAQYGRKPTDGEFVHFNRAEETTYVLARLDETVFKFEVTFLFKDKKSDTSEIKTFIVRANSLVEAAIRASELGVPDRDVLSISLKK